MLNRIISVTVIGGWAGWTIGTYQIQNGLRFSKYWFYITIFWTLWFCSLQLQKLSRRRNNLKQWLNIMTALQLVIVGNKYNPSHSNSKYHFHGLIFMIVSKVHHITSILCWIEILPFSSFHSFLHCARTTPFGGIENYHCMQ